VILGVRVLALAGLHGNSAADGEISAAGDSPRMAGGCWCPRSGRRVTRRRRCGGGSCSRAAASYQRKGDDGDDPPPAATPGWLTRPCRGTHPSLRARRRLDFLARMCRTAVATCCGTPCHPRGPCAPSVDPIVCPAPRSQAGCRPAYAQRVIFGLQRSARAGLGQLARQNAQSLARAGRRVSVRASVLRCGTAGPELVPGGGRR